VVGYPVHSAREAKTHQINAHDDSNVGSDRHQWSPMAKDAHDIQGKKRLEVVADRGYYKGDEIRACELAGMDAYVPKSTTSPNKAKGQFDRAAFRYSGRSDEYECPAGERLTYRLSRTEPGKEIRRYRTSASTHCAIKAQCTTGDNL
jgi:hypothetical protein